MNYVIFIHTTEKLILNAEISINTNLFMGESGNYFCSNAIFNLHIYNVIEHKLTVWAHVADNIIQNAKYSVCLKVAYND